MGLEHWDSYYEAAVKMYTEEVGVSPVQGNPAGYRFYVRQLITTGRAFGMIRGRSGRVQGRRRLGGRLGLPGAGRLARPVAARPRSGGAGDGGRRPARPDHRPDRVSLYVNDYNLPARATYLRVGFADVGEFATIHY